jgi:soluble lytic murein transglycosylase
MTAGRSHLPGAFIVCLLATGAWLILSSAPITAGQPEAQQRGTPESLLVATAHPPLPTELSFYWLIPDAAIAVSERRPNQGATSRLAQGVELVAKGDFAPALTLVSGADLSSSPLDAYARYYTGVALFGLGRYEEALSTFSLLAARPLEGTLKELVPLRLADAALALQRPERAEGILVALTGEKLASPEDVWLQRATVEEAAGHPERALASYRRLHYDFPLSTQASAAAEGIARLRAPAQPTPELFRRGLARAQLLFDARRWADARSAYTTLSPWASSADDKELIALRVAESDHFLGNRRAARTALQPLFKSVRGAEARYYYLLATRALGDRGSYVKLARSLVADHPDSPWAEETLNNLASHYVAIDNDAEADRVFRELLRAFPRGRYAERASWKVGWRAFRTRSFAETAETFERAAGAFPRADSRPAWLYWSGRARDNLGDAGTANARYRLVVQDYQNSYYGRMATALLTARRAQPTSARIGPAPSEAVSAVVSNTTLIRELAAARMYSDALREVQYAQRIWGDSPKLQATSAWIRHNQGMTLTAEERFQALRGAITTMRRAYPQFMAAGGEGLPPDILRIIFPLDYWPLITKYSETHNLDRYLIAALMAQESTFTAEIRSAANAYGLMQIIPSTGRVYARKLGIRAFSTALLRQPETNVRIGTQYFRDLIDRFGGVHLALAGYNAGERRVVQWLSERHGVPQDEFIDDIPFPETQNYVKRILGTTEDYRRLYGADGAPLTTAASAPRASGSVAASVPTTPARSSATDAASSSR